MHATKLPSTTASESGPEGLEGWIFGRFSRRISLLQKFTLRQQIKSFGTYQPIELDGRQLRSGDRECADRWNVIEAVTANDKVSSLLDLGCAEGYFVRQAATKLGCVALGVEADMRRVTVAQSVTVQQGIVGAGYLLGYITPEFIQKLPVFDVIIFCSVLHHIMAAQGLDEARKVLDAVRSRTAKAMIFDMGQSEETGHEWASFLPRMTPDALTWITGFLKDCGFTDVQVLGQTEGYHRLFPRHLFIARP